MPTNRFLVEGPDWLRLVRETNRKIQVLERNNWDFNAVPEAFARGDQGADVVAKELVHIHDGQTMTRIGRLIMGGIGHAFNLMGPIRSDAKLKVSSLEILDDVSRQIGSRGLSDVPQFNELNAVVQQVEFFNYGMFYTVRDLVFWLLIHDAGCYPSTLQHMVRKFAEGYVVQNDMYVPAKPSVGKKPVLMAGNGLMMQFPSRVVEWMDKPLFGGFAKDTIHVETLLTTKRVRISHPYLPLIDEGRVVVHNIPMYMRRFSGVTPKDALRGPGVPAESSKG
jgi:hypothetical protein